MNASATLKPHPEHADKSHRMNRAQRWLGVFFIFSFGRLLFVPPQPPASIPPAWVGALLSVVGLLCVWAGTRGQRRLKLTQRQVVASRWWVGAMSVQLLVSVAMMLTGAVPPRWFAGVTLFPLFAALFVTAGGMTREGSELDGKVMRALLLSGLALYLVTLAVSLALR